LAKIGRGGDNCWVQDDISFYKMSLDDMLFSYSFLAGHCVRSYKICSSKLLQGMFHHSSTLGMFPMIGFVWYACHGLTPDTSMLSHVLFFGPAVTQEFHFHTFSWPVSACDHIRCTAANRCKECFDTHQPLGRSLCLALSSTHAILAIILPWGVFCLPWE